MAEILHFEILRKHRQTHKQTDMGITIYLALPLWGANGGRGKYRGQNATFKENIARGLHSGKIGVKPPHSGKYRGPNSTYFVKL